MTEGPNLVHTLRTLIDGLTGDVRHHLDHGANPEAQRAFEAWAGGASARVLAGADRETLCAEFARQTAYVSIIRLLLARICEDKGLSRHPLADGGPARWEELGPRYRDYASGRSYDYMTPLACACAQNAMARCYGKEPVFDWYAMDEPALLRAIVALNAFDLRHIDADILGTVHGRYLREGKSEHGRYYTPAPLVRLMLDSLGYRGDSIVGLRLGDLACGSGSFLVEACRRLLEAYQGPDGRVPGARIEAAIADAQRSIIGLDLDPFACFLAETNLLIQVLDLVKQAQEEGQSFTLRGFAVHVTDSLLVDPKDTPGFDFLVGNPPYVRAPARAAPHVAYRRLLEGQGWFTTRHLRWDLYVPFVQQNQRLLSEGAGARACLVTIESLATAPYAAKLRELLARRCTLHDLVFLEKLGLFPDASWQDNLVLCFSRGVPAADHAVRRWIARAPRGEGGLSLEPLDVLAQARVEPSRLFTRRAEVALDLGGTRRWDEICYVSKGMVLHSHEERCGEGEVFGRGDLVAEARDAVHTRRFVGSREVRQGGIGRTRWLEYGAHTRCPARVSRPTFPELYDRVKIMFGTFTGVAVDDGSSGDFLTTNDSVRLSVRWELLEGLSNRALADERNGLKRQGRYDPALSREFSEWYLCALALSAPVQAALRANRRSMKEHVYPEDIKAIPVKRISPAAQRPYIELAQERHALWAELTALEAGERVARAAVERRRARIAEIGAAIDRLAWALYRPRAEAPAPALGLGVVENR